MLIILFLAGIIGPFIIIGTQWENMTSDGSLYYFYEFELEYRVIALIESIGLFPCGIYGLVSISKRYKQRDKSQHFKMGKKAKVAGLIIVCWGLGIGYNHFPAAPYDLGWVHPNLGPYLQYSPDGSMIISWDTSQLDDTVLKWGTVESDLPHEATGGKYYAGSQELSYHHAVKLAGLEPGQEYFYSLPSISKAVYKFRTAPAVDSLEPVTFTIVGDTQQSFNNKKLNLQWMKVDPDGLDFTVIAGDVVHWDNSMEEWMELFHKDTYGGITHEIPLMVSSGNHETYCAVLSSDCTNREYFKLHFQNDFPNSGNKAENSKDTGYYFSYNYSNVHMVALDNFESIHAPLLTNPQLEWLKQDLGRNEANWKFVYFHVPLYSIMHNSGDDYRSQLEPIFQDYGVDAVIYAHQHDLEVFQVNATATDSGIYHFLVGGGGGTLENFYLDKYGEKQWPTPRITAEDLGPEFDDIVAKDYFLLGDSIHHYMKVNVAGDSATFTLIRTSDGEEIGEFSAIR